jgi:hypothetical protein
MIIANLPTHPAPMFVSQPTFAISPKMVKDTIYMPSSVAAKVLGGRDRKVKTDTKGDQKVA